MSDDPKVLTEKGARILARGGDDGSSDDDLLVLEIINRCPGISPQDAQTLFVSLRLECGEDALYAVRNGYVSFEARKPQ